MRRLLGVAVAGLLLVGCSGSPGETGGSVTTSTAAVGADPGGATTTTIVTTTVAAAEADQLFRGVNGRVTLLTSSSGGGIRPSLEWEPVADADHYAVFLYAPSGAVYWSWAGTATSVHVGGEPRLRDDAPGPSVIDGMSWAVIAYDADLLPIAVSELRPIAP